MIKGRNIICVAFPSWNGDYMKAIVQMMSVLARENNVLYVDYEHTYKDVLMTLIGRQHSPIKKILGIQKRLQQIPLENGGQIHLLTPPAVMPINWLDNKALYKAILMQNGQRVHRAIREVIEKLKLYNPIVINAFNPFYGFPLKGLLGEKLLVYYCYDEISEAAWCGKHGVRMEDDFMPHTDAVVTTSQALWESKRRKKNPCYLVKNGVDFPLFHQAYLLKKKKADTRKVIGYVGSVDNRLDYSLLAQVIETMPQCDFVFLGRVQNHGGKKMLGKYPNVQFLGSTSPQKLPSYLKNMDLGMIPFVKNKFTENIYPLKINEYLATGIPVVSTDFADMSDFAGMISITTTRKAFAEAIEQELQNDTAEKIQARIEMARANSWENRAEQLSEIILTLLEDKKLLEVC